MNPGFSRLSLVPPLTGDSEVRKAGRGRRPPSPSPVRPSPVLTRVVFRMAAAASSVARVPSFSGLVSDERADSAMGAFTYDVPKNF